MYGTKNVVIIVQKLSVQKRIMHANQGFELLQGSGVFQGKILGGCIDSLYDILIQQDIVILLNYVENMICFQI